MFEVRIKPERDSNNTYPESIKFEVWSSDGVDKVAIHIDDRELWFTKKDLQAILNLI